MFRIAALLPALVLAGCVERLIAVRSEPPGATVYLDDEKAGKTPIEIPYTWYGKRDLRLELKDHEAARRLIVLNPPWWQFFPFDFITDVLLPFTITDRIEFTFELKPALPVHEELDSVRGRAAELRDKAGVPK